jgi:hypothetical protein
MANIFRVLGLPCITSDFFLNIDLIYSEGRTLSFKSNSFMWLRIIPRTGIEPVPLGEPDAGLAARHLTACAQLDHEHTHITLCTGLAALKNIQLLF